MAETLSTRPWVLLLEDEAELVTILCESLKDEYQIDVAVNAEEALKLLNGRAYDLILSDLMLPGKKQGLDFLLLAMYQQPKAKRILMSGYLSPELLARSVPLAQLSACLMKPVEMSLLRQELRAALAPGARA
jgi:two-component system response regulator HydG